MAGKAKGNDPVVLKGGTHVEIEKATSIKVSFSGGEGSISAKFDLKALKASRRELDRLSQSKFEAYIVIEGEVVEEQLELGTAEAPGDEGDDE